MALSQPTPEREQYALWRQVEEYERSLRDMSIRHAQAAENERDPPDA